MKKLLLIACLCLGLQWSNAQKIPSWKIADVETFLKSSTANVLVINCWATFCKPCVAEIPSFIKITDQYKARGVKLLLLSLDLPSFYPKKLAAFVKKQGYQADVAWLNETNADYFCPKIDAAWSGSIPATLILNTKTGYRKFFEEEIGAEDFEKELKLALASEKW